ncbi:MAG: hypothetical protein EA347_08215 [Thioalkalivibrio sp.]|nr:MAG: hypothetical protein EA347_08215 [Thioalkalivibrio sp.]
MTYTTTLIAACVTVGVLMTGTTKSALADSERTAAHPSVAVEHRFAQVRDRGRGDRHFQAEPEFPPNDYLGDVEVPGEYRPDVSGPGSLSPEDWYESADTPPAFGGGTDIPRHDRGEFPATPPGAASRERFPPPAMPTDPAQQGWGGFPAEETWDDRMPATRGGMDDRWPLPPPTEGGYPGASEYPSEAWDRTRPQAAPEGRPPFPDEPRGGFDPWR